MDQARPHARQRLQAGPVPDDQRRAHRHADGESVMNRLLSLVLACTFAAAPTLAVAQQKNQLPEEKKGTDPAPDTQAAEGYLKRAMYEQAIQTSKLALGRDERYVPAMIVMAKAYFFLKKYEL